MNDIFEKYKVSGDPTFGFSETPLFRKKIVGHPNRLAIRMFCLATDIPIIHGWVNEPYSQKFWQMAASEPALYKYYWHQIKEGHLRPMMLYFDDISPIYVAQVDVYQVLKDELAGYIEAQASDYGLHLLMTPYRELKQVYRHPLKNLSREVLLLTMESLFSLGAAERILVEPDCLNVTANKLVRELGFRFLKEIPMSYKRANLYQYDKVDFLKEHPKTI